MESSLSFKFNISLVIPSLQLSAELDINFIKHYFEIIIKKANSKEVMYYFLEQIYAYYIFQIQKEKQRGISCLA